MPPEFYHQPETNAEQMTCIPMVPGGPLSPPSLVYLSTDPFLTMLDNIIC